MELKYLLDGLSYPSTIKWYIESNNATFMLGEVNYTFHKIKELINALETNIIVTQFKQIDNYNYEITVK